MLKTIHDYFIEKDRGYSFEKFAADIIMYMDDAVASIDTTRPFKDGGFDAEGRYKIFKNVDNSIYVDFYVQAKQFPFVNYSTCVRELEHAIYEFDKNNPDMGIHNYGAILEENGIEWGIRSMEAADVSKLDATVILALLLGAVRAERFCDGALLSFLESGAVLRWLERLKEIEEQ